MIRHIEKVIYKNMLASNLTRSVSAITLGYMLLASAAWANPSAQAQPRATPTSGQLVVGANTETVRVLDQGASPFAISVDGQPLIRTKDPKQPFVLGHASRQIDKERQTDLSLEMMNVQVKYDGLNVKPVLNLRVASPRNQFHPGDTINFVPTTNYPDFIARAEIRIKQLKSDPFAPEPMILLPVQVGQNATWVMPRGQGVQTYEYVLRVYDRDGRYDETAPLVLTGNALSPQTPAAFRFNTLGATENNTALRNIPLQGGSVVVYGDYVPLGSQVTVMGQPVAVSENQKFVVERILPAGAHEVDVMVSGGPKDGGYAISRDINIPQDDWFYIGMADLTLGKRGGDARIEEVRPGEYDSLYKRGRLAFYLKGKVKGEYLITAAADTDEQELNEIFGNMGKQNARHILRNLDPDAYYPVYGDDSTMIEDAPTDGRFYIRVEKGDSHVLWGNYDTRIDGTQLLNSNRSLYGAKLAHKSQTTTSFGERESEVTVYAAQADTLLQVDEFLGTGGSAYFLKRQNIVGGSETLIIEVRDHITGRVLERRVLTAGTDYRFDNLQGVVILNRPLFSTTGSSAPVRDGALGGNRNFLIVQYEYEPLVGDVNEYSYGGRSQVWVNDKLRLAVTGFHDKNGAQDHKAGAVDLRYRHSDTSFLDLEIAGSRGEAFNVARSFDGGLSLSRDDVVNRRPGTASAYRVEGELDFKDIAPTTQNGGISAYFERRDAGFSSLTNYTNYDTNLWGLGADVGVSDQMRVQLSFDHYDDASDKKRIESAVSIVQTLNEQWDIAYGAEYTDLNLPNAVRSGKAGYAGNRTDLGVRLSYTPDERKSLYFFGQGTAHRSGDIDKNDRLGAGGEFRLSDTLGARAELSYGTHGVGGLAGLTYDPNANSHYYFGYELNPEREYDLSGYQELYGRDRGAFVAGMRRKVNDNVSVYAENSYDLFGKRTSLAQTYGVNYTPDNFWTLNTGLEWGHIQDHTINNQTGFENSDFKRFAPSVELSYKDEAQGVVGRVRGELRHERSQDQTRDQDTYLFATGVSWKTNDNWRAFAGADLVYSDTKATTVSYNDTKYLEATLGYAYRPIDDGKLQALFKYSWLYDLPGNGQRVNGTSANDFAAAQRSHIVSADLNYNLRPWLTIGGKYGFRIGEIKYARGSSMPTFDPEWQKSSAHLLVGRMDFHIVKEWDVLVEARRLSMPKADTVEHGALVALYRHIGDNFKVGVGYNFGRFSDDLRDLKMNDHGTFLNLVAKF